MTISGIITADADLRWRFKHRSGFKAVEERSVNDQIVTMGANGIDACVSAHPSGCLVAVAAAAPIPNGDATTFANSLLDDYLVNGPTFVENRLGQFSFAIWDSRRGHLHLYRDRIGVPPIFYWKSDHGLAWATTIELLLQVGAPRSVDNLALGHYQLAGYIQSPRTMVESVRKIPAAHRLEWKGNREEVTRYWAPSWVPKVGHDANDETEIVQSLMSQAIRRATPESGRVGILLSGGIDSVGLAVAASQVDGLEVDAFTFKYSDYNGPFNESGPARAVTRVLGIPHHEIEIGPSYVEERLSELLTSYEEPFTYGLHSARMEPISKHDIQVVLTGAKGATWAVSRARAIGMALGDLLPNIILTKARDVTDRLPETMHDLGTLLEIATATDPQRYLAIAQQSVLKDQHAASLHMRPELIQDARSDLVNCLSTTTENTEEMSSKDRLALLGLSSFGPEHLLWWSYRWADSAGLSIRFPLLDFDYVDYMAHKPKRDKETSDRRRMAAKYIPAPYAHRKKVAQTAPLSDWMRGPLAGWARSILNREEVEAEGTFRFDTLDNCLQEHEAGIGDHKWCIWTCLSYLLWKQVFLESV